MPLKRETAISNSVRQLLDLRADQYPTLVSLEPFAPQIAEINIASSERAYGIGPKRLSMIFDWLNDLGYMAPNSNSVMTRVA